MMGLQFKNMYPWFKPSMRSHYHVEYLLEDEERPRYSHRASRAFRSEAEADELIRRRVFYHPSKIERFITGVCEAEECWEDVARDILAAREKLFARIFWTVGAIAIFAFLYFAR